MTQSSTSEAREPYSPDDLAVWPDGFHAELGDPWNGDYDWRSDDYEMVRLEDEARLRELGLDELIDGSPG